MAAKRNITLCTGTTCYVMGAAELLGELEGAVDSGRLGASLKGSTCLGYCKSRENGDAPFVEVDGRPVAVATLERLEELSNE